MNYSIVRQLICYFFLFTSSAQAQHLWISDAEKEKGTLIKTEVFDSTSFVAVVREYTGGDYVFSLKAYSGLELQYKTVLPTYFQENDLYYKEFIAVKDTLFVFFCVTTNTSFDYYIQRYDSRCYEIGAPIFLVSYPNLSNKHWDNGNILVSADKSSYLIYCAINDNRLNTEIFKFSRFSINHRLLQTDEIAASKSAEDVSFNDVWLKNDGKVVVSEYVFFNKLLTEKKSQRRMEVVKLHVYAKNEHNLITLVPPANEYLTHVECALHENEITGIGVYCEEDDHFKGLFTFAIADTLTGETTVQLFPRSQSIALSSYDLRFSNRQTVQQENRKYVCNDMKLIHRANHGDTLVYIWERFALTLHHDSQHFQSRDILIVKVFQDSIIRLQIIPKVAKSYNDGGQNIRSFVHRSSEDQLQFFFNDYSNLYSNNGTYLAESPFLTRNRDNHSPFSIIEVNLNLSTLEYTREVRFDHTTFEVSSSCAQWQKLKNGKALLVFTKGKRFRVAYWDFSI